MLAILSLLVVSVTVVVAGMLPSLAHDHDDGGS